MPESLLTKPTPFRVDWGELAPLRLKARAVAEGVYAGMHRSVRKGAGVDFGGKRAYVPGDDLRFLDRRALLCHEKLMVRELETETDRALWLCVDATASMAYRSEGAPGAKLAYAALIAAALARVALSSGDPVGLAFVGGEGTRSLSASAGREAFERVVGTLEAVSAAGDATTDAKMTGSKGESGTAMIERAIAPIAKKARRGAVIVFLSDLIDLPPGTASTLAPLAMNGRTLMVVQVLDPAEVRLPFEGSVRLRTLEGGHVVEADADQVRAQYTERLRALTAGWAREVEARGGRLIRATTTDSATAITRTLIRAIAGFGASDLGDSEAAGRSGEARS